MDQETDAVRRPKRPGYNAKLKFDAEFVRALTECCSSLICLAHEKLKSNFAQILAAN
jgi:hypothetical protein